ncbi:major facilitator superfamily domain-containing protein 4A isoform X3 [Epinephelus moara]|uniref:major facilitator superfamily domain-containing protein 4A isoform X3 n=1 Tax=Epinephelus moara TaxID=300413 RepID=UPI00214E5D0B|nr:major facilitator superfamily domain-containing protein 4A isoform X3 [Epinephelus moara]
MKLLDERIWSLFKRNWQHTLTYWSVFFSFGLCIAFLGPTILDLRCQTQSTLQQITWVFFSQQFFLLVGSGLGGLFKKTLLFSLSALFSCTFIISLVFSIIPLCNHVVLLSVAMAIAGLAMGVIDTIANLQLVKLYQKDSATFLQALHFFIGLGALVSPLVADPFLADDNCVLGANWTANSSSSSDLEHLRSSLAGHGGLPNISRYPLHTEGMVITRVSYAFWIMAVINLPVPAAVLALMYHERLLPCSNNSPRLLDRDSVSSASPTWDSGQGHGSVFGCCNRAKLRGRPATFFLLHVLGGAILFITDGIVVGVILVQCLLLIFYTSCVFLFIGTCVLGLCISSVFPSMLAFTEDILDYKGCATTVLVTSASTGEMMLQLLVGLVIHSQGSYSFLLCCTVASFIGFCLFLILLYVQHRHRNCPTDSSDNTDMKEKPKTGAS